jgi:predicted DNA-binding protein
MVKDSRINVRIPKELHKKLKIKCNAYGHTISDIVTEYIKIYLERHEER